MTAQIAARRAAVIAEALTWLGTPYHHQGRVKGAGVDCGMLLVEVYAACGEITAMDAGNYACDWHLHRSEEKYLEHVLSVAHEIDAAQPGGIAVFQFGRTYSHGAICIGDNKLIHSYRERGCEITTFDDCELVERPRRFFSIW
jgi:cell wall-associated NlpC family hydrolase